ncbi:AtpZ/AtpI family protein [Hansschlegelia sp.]|uniref:AtpZ/AtpI family protein n=1 Tax=Hansschlegelia sp. TaxID=2041892 RepID=UPI002C512036|nr:AtpZ/AtpI family protein [Hansschlegelia sp.]HVI30270.1 AtpZ/AtpI family protein [Hansschlegelia sp.]
MTQSSDGKPDRPHPAGEGDLSGRLDRLGKQLKQRSETETKAEAGGRMGSMGGGLANALRLSSEFVAGVVAGGLIGWGFDHFLGTTPWGLIVFLLLGFVAGVLNVMRAAGLAPGPRAD